MKGLIRKITGQFKKHLGAKNHPHVKKMHKHFQDTLTEQLHKKAKKKWGKKPC